MPNLALIVALAAATTVTFGAGAGTLVTPDEMARRDAWSRESLKPGNPAPSLPFSFVYDGRPSSAVLSNWNQTSASRRLDETRSERMLSWQDPVRCVAVEYAAFPTLEWTLYFKNTGTQDTPIVSDVLALDATLVRGEQGEFLLHHQAGSTATVDDYRPFETPLKQKNTLRLASSGGRGSDGCWPYFNLDWGKEGMIVVIGWPGQWSASFIRDEQRLLRIRAGQEQTRFKLLPGEEVRTPLVVLQF